MNEEFFPKLREVLKENQILTEEPMAKHTTFQIGGPADFLLLPETVSQIVAILRLCQKEGIPFYVIGNGSNLLVSDEGFRGIIIKLDQAFSNITVEEADTSETESMTKTAADGEAPEKSKRYLIRAQAGVMLSKLANRAMEEGLTGLEFASGIPGTLGGAVTMNAGAYNGEIKQSILSATVADREGNVKTLNRDELKLGYRKSIIQEKNYIVLEAVFCLKSGNKEEIQETMRDYNTRRRDKQPLEYPSAGSTFKRPEGHYAGKLIMDAGLRGYRLGNAQVSHKHCGFVINTGGATAVQVRALMSHVIETVYNKYGVMLEPEVRFLGRF